MYLKEWKIVQMGTTKHSMNEMQPFLTDLFICIYVLKSTFASENPIKTIIQTTKNLHL